MALPVKYETPARYKVLKTSYLNDVLVPASVLADSDTGAPGRDSFVMYDGHPGMELEPVDDEGRKRKAAYLASKGTTEPQMQHRRKMLEEGAGDTEGALSALAGQIAPAAPIDPLTERLARELDERKSDEPPAPVV